MTCKSSEEDVAFLTVEALGWHWDAEIIKPSGMAERLTRELDIDIDRLEQPQLLKTNDISFLCSSLYWITCPEWEPPSGIYFTEIDDTLFRFTGCVESFERVSEFSRETSDPYRLIEQFRFRCMFARHTNDIFLYLLTRKDNHLEKSSHLHSKYYSAVRIFSSDDLISGSCSALTGNCLGFTDFIVDQSNAISFKSGIDFSTDWLNINFDLIPTCTSNSRSEFEIELKRLLRLSATGSALEYSAYYSGVEIISFESFEDSVEFQEVDKTISVFHRNTDSDTMLFLLLRLIIWLRRLDQEKMGLGSPVLDSDFVETQAWHRLKHLDELLVMMRVIIELKEVIDSSTVLAVFRKYGLTCMYTGVRNGLSKSELLCIYRKNTRVFEAPFLPLFQLRL